MNGSIQTQIIMKIHPHFLAIILALLGSITMTRAQASAQAGTPPVAGAVNPTTGLPVALPHTGFNLPPGTGPLIDPVTGLPIEQQPEWKDSDWKDPAMTLTNIAWNGLPLSEVVRGLQDQFGAAFDIIVPTSIPQYDNQEPVNPSIYTINLKLKNVRASEVFGAMNMEFEVEGAPFRWQLTMNGTRQTALLKIHPELVRSLPYRDRKVFYVGDLLNSGMSADKLSQILSDVWSKAGWSSDNGTIELYQPAQLVIITGKKDQIDFTQQTLVALREQAELNQTNSHKAEKSGSPAAAK